MLHEITSLILLICVITIAGLSVVAGWLAFVCFLEERYSLARRSFNTALIFAFFAAAINILR